MGNQLGFIFPSAYSSDFNGKTIGFYSPISIFILLKWENNRVLFSHSHVHLTLMGKQPGFILPLAYSSYLNGKTTGFYFPISMFILLKWENNRVLFSHQHVHLTLMGKQPGFILPFACSSYINGKTTEVYSPISIFILLKWENNRGLFSHSHDYLT